MLIWLMSNYDTTKQRCYTIDNSKTLIHAYEQLQNNTYDVVFLDLSLPDSDGINTVEAIRKLDTKTPIIVLTGNEDDKTINEVVQFGAQDYIHKNDFNARTIDRTIRYAIDRKRTEHELELLAHTDALTKLFNRALFLDRLAHCLLRVKRQPNNGSLAVLLLDLDNFKIINDSMGHSVGDALLIQVANRVRSCVRETDTVARLGGDEFIILFENVEQLITINHIATKILHAIAKPFIIDNKPIFSSASIGVANSNTLKDDTSETIIKYADIAMYNAKKKGGNQVAFFTRELQVTAQIRNNLEKCLRAAIEKDEFCLHFQPQINISNGDIYGAEALIRWNHPEHGLIQPTNFIPALEETGLIIPATEWVIEKALETWQKWRLQKLINNTATISINISPKFFRHHSAYEAIENITNQFNIHSNQIEFELTENAFIDISPKNLHLLKRLKDEGYRLSIDDFGTGYSCLSYLKSFPIDGIKLDRALIKDITVSDKDAAITEAMIQLCEKLKINLIAEGVDNKATLIALKQLGCRLIQGFYFSKPLDTASFIYYVQNTDNKF
jgi:diguanylate cyclase (GGDEF)-like protein